MSGDDPPGDHLFEEAVLCGVRRHWAGIGSAALAVRLVRESNGRHLGSLSCRVEGGAGVGKKKSNRAYATEKTEDVFENEKVISCKVDMRSGAQRERNPREWRPEDCATSQEWKSPVERMPLQASPWSVSSRGMKYGCQVYQQNPGLVLRLRNPKGGEGGVGFDVATRGERSITVTCLAADYLDLITDEAPKVPTAKEGQPPHERLSGTILVTDGALISVRVSWALSFAGIGCPSSCVQRQRGRSSTKTRGYGTVHDEQTLFERGLLSVVKSTGLWKFPTPLRCRRCSAGGKSRQVRLRSRGHMDDSDNLDNLDSLDDRKSRTLEEDTRVVVVGPLVFACAYTTTRSERSAANLPRFCNAEGRFWELALLQRYFGRSDCPPSDKLPPTSECPLSYDPLDYPGMYFRSIEAAFLWGYTIPQQSCRARPSSQKSEFTQRPSDADRPFLNLTLRAVSCSIQSLMLYGRRLLQVPELMLDVIAIAG
ncbi:hypothetical protein FA13DRAFT_1705467 [Coprinellus micaceus]|uniref:Uncharacterized protein n=1 Tax=Coprinellus micaceus TaxID=71717 RepID=A0A4Y7TT64_COPMI|nr:hypothetical protein FA13DRAFT_1705467 [Coprinellus micaceus]